MGLSGRRSRFLFWLFFCLEKRFFCSNKQQLILVLTFNELAWPCWSRYLRKSEKSKLCIDLIFELSGSQWLLVIKQFSGSCRAVFSGNPVVFVYLSVVCLRFFCSLAMAVKEANTWMSISLSLPLMPSPSPQIVITQPSTSPRPSLSQFWGGHLFTSLLLAKAVTRGQFTGVHLFEPAGDALTQPSTSPYPALTHPLTVICLPFCCLSTAFLLIVTGQGCKRG